MQETTGGPPVKSCNAREIENVRQKPVDITSNFKIDMNREAKEVV
jgi:hypothetical protein